MDRFIDLLSVYYPRLFPLDDYYKWLSYGDASTFSRREFSFTLVGDVYLRYQTFNDVSDLKKELLRLLPIKIDIGAVYNVCPSKSKTMEPLERELVFDIDMTDYDEVRVCCSGADICNKCWKYMAIACKILDVALREDFGFEHILWVFSGRRGIHAWVCDPMARTLDSVQRGAVAEYLQVLTGGAYVKKKVNLYKIHSSIKRALTIITPVFNAFCVEEQNMLGTNENCDKFLELFTDEEIKEEIKNIFKKYTKSLDRWEAFKDYATDKIKNSKKWRVHKNIIEEIMLQYCYPRLDINVTKGLNHLLKSPFCVHPQTGKVSIPFNPKTVDKFDPLTVPTIETVVKELDDFENKNKEIEEGPDASKKIKDYKKTSLNKPLHVFREFIHKLEQARNNDNEVVTDAATPMEF